MKQKKTIPPFPMLIRGGDRDFLRGRGKPVQKFFYQDCRYLFVIIIYLQLATKEMDELNNSFSNLSDSHTKGITLKGTHYKIIRADKYSIYAKKVNKSIFTLYQILIMTIIILKNNLNSTCYMQILLLSCLLLQCG